MKLCEFCAGAEATKEKTTYGVTVYLCDNCFECEMTMTEEDFERVLKEAKSQ